MADMLRAASTWLDGQRKAHLSRTVTYRRDTASAAVQAAVGRTEFEVSDDYGVVQRWESRDFLILAEDLADFGLPKEKDRIIETQGAETFVYEVMAPAGQAPWRWSDPYRKTLRIHTKQVGST